MTRLRHHTPTLTIVIALLTAGCGGGASTREEPTDEPSSMAFTVYTHCGVENVRIDGQWWHAEPPLYNKERSGPPTGWDNPYQEGTLTREAIDRAVFEALGQRVVFVPASDNQPVRVCR